MSIKSKHISQEMTTDEELASALQSKQDLLGFTPENISHKNQANGYAGLDSNGKVLISLLPSGNGGTDPEVTAHLSNSSNPHNVTKDQLGLGNVQNLDQTNPINITQNASYRFVSDSEKTSWNSKQNALGFTPENIANKNQVNGYAGLNQLGKVALEQLPLRQVNLILNWDKLGQTPAINTSQDGLTLEGFSHTDINDLFSLFTIPSPYQTGTQIKLSGGSFFINSSDDDVSFKAQSSLLRVGTSIIGNGNYTSTNFNIPPSPSNLLKSIGDIDITDQNGKINNISVMAGDTVRIRLFRDITSEEISSQTAHLLIGSLSISYYAN